MQIEVNKKEILLLLSGTPPSFDLMDNELIATYGGFDGKYYEWDEDKLSELSDQEIYNLYLMCRDSWNE